MVGADSHHVSRVRCYSGNPSALNEVFDNWSFTIYGAAFHPLSLTCLITFIGLLQPQLINQLVWASPLSLATTYGISSISFPPVTKMFQFTGYSVLAPICLRTFKARRRSITPVRLSHSEITGSKRACRSPMLIAAYHVLHRLLAPRHPLCALSSLINLHDVPRFPEILKL